MGNKNLSEAKKAKNDLFYTRLTDIEKELKNYKDCFKDKTVYCNCDDSEFSMFWKYFELCFEHLGLKKLIATHYDATKPTYKIELTKDINGDGKVTKEDIVKTPLKCNGDFRSDECIELLKEADIVVTNPPFSLFREYLAQLVKYKKQFLIIGNPNAITYKEIFPLIKDNKIWLGYKSSGTDMLFTTTPEFEAELRATKKERSGWRIIDGQFLARASAIWFTNLPTKKRTEELILFRKFEQSKYPMYDNYLAFNVDKVADIPADKDIVIDTTKEVYDRFVNSNQQFDLMETDGVNYKLMIKNPVWGVPITFLDNYCPKQFEIVEFRKGDDGKDLVYSKLDVEREREFSLTSEYSSVDASSRINEQSKGHDSKRKEQVCSYSNSTLVNYGCDEPHILIEDAKKVGKEIFQSRVVGNCIKTYHRIFIKRIN